VSTDAFRAKKLKFVIGGLVIVVAVAYLIFTALRSSASYFLTVSELQARGPEFYGRNVRVSGQVVADSIDWNARDLLLRFEIADEDGRRLRVVFNGPKPDQMRGEVQAIVEGKYLESGEFQASDLLMKCPSRYEEGQTGQPPAGSKLREGSGKE
jgi:cytochrome c-type biogenesis protein CcmE